MATFLSPHFTLEEFQVGSQGGPVPASLRWKLRVLCWALESVRGRVGRMKVTSGYRPNDPKSQHGQCEAVDLNFLDMSRDDAFKIFLEALAFGVPFDSIIIYEDTNHLHVSLDPMRKSRGTVLVALKKRNADGSRKYVNWDTYKGPLKK